ncbi:MAG: selenocysteine-specific translation elongation factor [Deltaproteobacteria bacterium]|nr:selenocysteine-specific translation elongation factor [Deltaproteobacteria bacterium]MBW2662469.1 selenocysteine-specific translation elongation factor [Deltaproteobacteria bacterium]
MKQIIFGTAGHVDHGKTALIRAVTGINTDRLKEEKLRGITIELGFASMNLPSGRHLGIVDVPGHEKFVKHMVAGATGIDIVAMVIAADEGVMPQTREHMEICSLLGIKHGFVVLTKTDMVDEEWLELVQDDVKEFLKDTFLENSPIIPVSSVTGSGIPEFIKTLDEISATIPERPLTGLFRLPVDRVFSMKGFGTVITGTLISGSIHTGDIIMVYPSGITSKIRGIQVHNETVSMAEAGMRTAVNFQGLDKTAVNRGDVLSTPGDLNPSYMLDVSFHLLDNNKKPVKTRTRIRFHSGTSEVLGILVLLDKDELSPGKTTVAQLRLDSPVSVVKDDRFVIRSYSPVHTIGGGHILNPIPQKHKGFKPELVKGLQAIDDSKPEEIIDYHVNESGYLGVSFSDLKIMTNLSEKQLNNAMQGLMSKKTIVCFDKDSRFYIHNNNLEKLKKESCNYLDNYHKSNPLKAGMPKEELKSKFSSFLNSKLFHLMLSQLINNKEIIQEEDSVHLSSHTVSLEADQSVIRKKIIDAYAKSKLTPPYFKELSKTLDIDATRAKDVLMLLVEEGLILKIKEDLYFYAEAVNDLKSRLVDYLKLNKEITTPQFKDMASVSRKFLIPLIEYFDSTNVTLRVGDSRKLRNR